MIVRFTVPPDFRNYDECAVMQPPEMKMNAVPRVGDTVVVLLMPGHPQKVGFIVKDVYWEITDPEKPFVMVTLGEMKR